MPDPTDPHPVADDPSGIVQQMPEGRLRAEGRCSTDSTMRHFAYAVMVPDPDGDYVEYEKARATEADLRAEVERLREENALMAASLDEEERKCGLSTNGGMWRFWARQLREYHARRAAISPETDGGQSHD